MLRKIISIALFSLMLQTANVAAGTTGSEEMKKNNQNITANECFEGVSRVMFKFNHGLDNVVFEPVAKGYRALPVVVRQATGNFVNNLRSLLTFSNNVLQGDLKSAGTTAGRFVINSTVGILGIWDPATAFGFEATGKEDFGQTMGVWGAEPGCYFVLPVLGPTTTRDALGLVGNVFIDPVYQITHNTEINGGIGNESYSEHNYYYYRSTAAVDFRAKNIESFNSLEQNSIDLYASVKSLYLQDRRKKVLNLQTTVDTQSDEDWEEIETD